MPFQKNWRDYQAGDLLYGLAGPRGQLALFLNVDPLHTIDQYEIATVDRNHAGITHDPDFIDALNAHGKYNSVVAHGDVGWSLEDQQHWNADFNRMLGVAKRKCKGGLDWITHNTPRHIHFCLEGLNLIAAATKSYDGTAGGVADAPQGKAAAGYDPFVDKVRSITGAELRWVYRNRFDPRVSGQVQFWRRKVSWQPQAGGNYAKAGGAWYQCPPPWVDGGYPDVKAAWASYIPTHVPFHP